PAGAAALVGDVSDDASVRAAVASLDGLDVLVNNAGIGAQGDVTANDDDEWHRVFDINVVGIARVTRAALPLLRASSAGAIVNTCSVAALVGLPIRALYSATNGAVDTPWVGRLLDAADDPAAERAALNARQPSGRLVTPREVAETIVYLATA